MNPITRKSMSELVSFRSLIGFGEAATELQTFKNFKNYKVSLLNIHFFVTFAIFGKLLLVQYLTKPFEIMIIVICSFL